MNLHFNQFHRSAIIMMMVEMLKETEGMIVKGTSCSLPEVSYRCELQLILNHVNNDDFRDEEASTFTDNIINTDLMKAFFNNQEATLLMRMSQVLDDDKVDKDYYRSLLFRKKAYDDVMFRIDVLRVNRLD